MKLAFSGRRALILGGSCELALELAEAMMRASLTPVLTYRNQAGLNCISERLRVFAGSYETCRVIPTDPASLTDLFDFIDKELDFVVDFAQGRLEGLVASADTQEVGCYFIENVSFRAGLLKKAARAMLARRKGRLVFISSSAAGLPNPGQGFYAAAKLASEALYRNLGLELGGRGITTIILRPGYVEAGRGQRYLADHAQEVLKRVPIKRALTAREVAETILFFLSDSAGGFNAAVIPLDGGLTAGK